MQVQLDRNLLQLKTKAGIGIVIKVVANKAYYAERLKHIKAVQEALAQVEEQIRAAWWYRQSSRSCPSAEQISSDTETA